MKIVDVRCIPVANPEQERNYLFVKVETDEGIYGLGEAGITGKELAVQGVIEHFRPLLIGEDPSRIEFIWQRLYRGGFFKGAQIQTAAISAVDLALWDIRGKALGMPVYELLGGRCRDKAVCYSHIQGDVLEDFLRDAKRALAEGYKFLRLHALSEDDYVFDPRKTVRRTVEWTTALRENVGPDVEILVDFHTRLDPIDAVRLARALEPVEPYFIEDPVRSENSEAYRLVRDKTNLPIAGGEELATKWEFRPLIEGDLIDYVRLDLCIVGGLTEAKKIAGWAESHYQYLAPHNPLGPVSTAACLHLDLSSPLFGVQELPWLPGYMADVFPVQVEYEAGYLLPPKGPGLGVEIDEEAAAEYPVTLTGNREFRRDDGSITNW
jgi:galactonate dehydratase